MVEKPIPFVKETNNSLAEKAAATFQHRLEPDEDHPVELIVDGPCPACGHQIEHVERLIYIAGVDRLSAETGKAIIEHALPEIGHRMDREFIVLCDCSEEHPGRPNEHNGCGRYWSMNAMIELGT